MLLSAPAAGTTCLTGEPDFTLSPADGATGVPTNVEVKVWGYTVRETSHAWELRDAAGKSVPAELRRSVRGSRRLVRLKPTEPLAPEQPYQLFVAGKPVARFTTGAGEDREPPAAPVLTGAKFSGHFADENALPWNLEAKLADFTWTLEGTPSSPDAVYLVSLASDGMPQLLWTEPRLPVLSWGRCASNFPDDADPSVFELTVTAVDLAGNAAAPVKLTVRAPPDALPRPSRVWLFFAGGAAVIAIAAFMALRRSPRVR